MPRRLRTAGAALAVGIAVIGHASSASAGTDAVAGTFADAPSGAAAEVTGGTDGRIVTVRTLDPSGPGSLRDAVAGSDPRIVVFDVSGTIQLDTEIAVGSNVSIDGRGADITISGAGLVVSASTNVIIRNLRIIGGPSDDSNADAIGVLDGSSGVWIDHVELSDFPDGLLDVTQGSTDVTISWSHLHDHGKAMLLGDASRNGSEPLVDMTVHHNRFENTGERNPMMRQGNYTVVNNVLRNWGYDEASGYGMRADCGGHAWIEANEFDHGANTRSIRYIDGDKCEGDRFPAAVIENNRIDDDRLVDSTRTDAVAEPRDITVEPLTDALVASIDANAGWQDVASPYGIDAGATTATDPEPAPNAIGPADDSGPGDGEISSVVVFVGGMIAGLLLVGLAYLAMQGRRVGRGRS